MSVVINGTTGITTPAVDTQGNLAYTGTLTGGTGVINIGSGQLYKDASGNVGIGTSSPAARLQVSSDAGTGTATILAINNANTTFAAGLGSQLELQAGTGTFLGRVSAAMVGGAFNSGSALTFTNRAGASGYTNFVVNGSERMRIDSAGNVGIGTSSPNATSKLTLRDGTAASLYFGSDGAGGDQAYIALQKSADGLTFGVENRGFVWKTGSATVLGGTERMRIDSSGNLLVGGTTALGRVTLTSSGSQETLTTITSGAFWGLNSFHSNAGSQFFQIFQFGTPGSASVVGSIQGNNTSTSYNTSSDYRLKEDWQPMTGAITRLNQLKPVNFAWKINGSRVDGFLAHEAQEVVPEAVSGAKDAVDAEGKPEYQGIDQSKLVPLLTAALQEAVAEINSLKARLDAANL